MNEIKNIKLVLVPVFLFLSIPLFAQTGNTESMERESYDDVITHTPPSRKFIPIILQTHKGLLRFGEQDNYFTLPDGSFVNHTSETAYKEADKKTWELMLGRHAYYELLKFKYMSQVYADMNKTMFTTHTSSMYQKDKNSFTAQTYFLKLANAVINTEEIYRFFCNPKEEDCDYENKKDKYYYRNVGDVKNWGGKGANEFKKLDMYTTYVRENFEELQQWGSTFFPNDTKEGYFVITAHLSTYDFENGGYWLRTNTFINNGKLFRYMDLQPSNAHERKLLNPKGVEILYKLAPKEAEKLTETTKKFFMVFKIKIAIKGMEYNYGHLDTNYTLQSTIIELFKDDSLGDKLGEISIETMTTR